jgi:nucleoside-diphosphate-sugar epimerase
MPTLITGSSGLLGMYLVRDLLGRGEEITALYRTAIPSILSEEEKSKVKWVKGDILDVMLLEELMQECKTVYHCAGMISFNPSRRQEMFKINVEGTANVVNAALSAGIQKLVHVSSVAAIGRKRNNQVVHEDLKWDDNANPSYYGKTKYLGELEVWRGVAEGLDAVIVNPVIILGYADWNLGSSAIFKKAYDEFPFYTEGVSGFVDVEDVAKAMIMLMDSETTAQRFILSAENWKLRDAFTEMAKAFGKKPPRWKVSDWITEVVWRFEKWKSLFTGIDPLLTKETVDTARQIVHFDNSKILQALPEFSFKPVSDTIKECCEKYLTLVPNN